MNQTAQGLAALGRGPDTQLVHMAPSEVAGLQALAKHHGGSLSINPATGLPEAGFLSSILPMVIGAGLIAATGGAAAPAVLGMSMPTAIGVGIGGLETLRTGSLSKGLMAGLGAYGGAGLGAGLMGAGAGAATVGAPELLGNAGAEMAAQAAAPTTMAGNLTNMGQGVAGLGTEAGRASVLANLGGGMNAAKLGLAAAAPVIMQPPETVTKVESDTGLIRPYEYNRTKIPTAFEDTPGEQMASKERRYFTDSYTPLQPYAAPGKEYGKNGILAGLPGIGQPQYMASGGPVEAMSNANAIGANTGFPQADVRAGAYSTPYQQPIARNVVSGAQDAAVDPYTGQVQFAKGGLSDLGGYSDGGQLLRGSGDGVSDSIPASIGDKQPARLADGEFVVPARIVSEIGNGSTDAGARKLYAMMDRIQKNRSKTVGKGQVAVNSRSDKMLPA